MCGASWCKPCKLLYPYFVDCSINYPSAAFYYGDIDNDSLSDIINTLNPKKIPVCYFLKNGTLLDTFIGGNHDTLDSLINQYL
jgi:thioredoxin-like negative regulator of GroEL